MSTLLIYCLYGIGVLNIITALMVLVRNSSRLSNIGFSSVSLFVGLWTLGVAAFLHVGANESLALVWAKMYYLAPLFLVVGLILFAYTFPRNRALPTRTMIRLLIILLISCAVVLLPDLLIRGVELSHFNNEVILNRVGYLLYSLFVLVGFFYSFVVLFRNMRSETGIYREQLTFFFICLVISVVIGLYFNLILPWFGTYSLIWAGPLAAGLFVVANAIAITRHKMFDIKVVILRSLGYLLSLVVLAALYGFTVFGLASVFFNLEVSWAVQVFVSLATAAASLLFGGLKSFFDRQTNRLFYRDAYDAEALFSDVNDVLISTINLERLMSGVARTIGNALKASDCVVVLKHGDANQYSSYSAAGETMIFESEDVPTILHHASKIKGGTWITDYLPEEHSKLARMLEKHDIALLSLLIDKKQVKTPLGFIMLRAKRSGNSYTSQDLRTIDTISKEIMIAIQNALQFEEIELFNITLQHRVEEATRQLRKTNEKLKLMDETKDDFVSMASHQLRTPLTSVKGYLSMVLDGDAGKVNAAQRKMLDQAFISTQRMTYLISDLLNVSRLKTGKFVIEPVPVNLATIVQQEMDQLVETLKARKLRLLYKPPATFPEMMLDETKTRQVIMNFIDNAIYYTPVGGRIEIKLAETAKTVELQVIDSGLGVPKHLQHHLFTKFYRAPNARQARPDGTGLGLFMAKKVIIAQGGAIIFRSTEGKGSTFGFSFPKNANQKNKT